MTDTPRTPSGAETALRLGREVDGVRRELAAMRERAERAERERDEARATKDMHKDRQQAEIALRLSAERERDHTDTERFDMAQQLKSEKAMHAICQNERDDARRNRDGNFDLYTLACKDRDAARAALRRYGRAGCGCRLTEDQDHVPGCPVALGEVTP